MADYSAGRASGSALGKTIQDLFRLLGSLRLAVVLIAVLAGVLAWATFVESAKGREYAQWYVYHSRWFSALLGLLALNIFASAVNRFPWGWRRTGFLITHGGLLVLLAGSIVTFKFGIEGQLGFEEGQTASSMTMTDRCQLTATWQDVGSSRPRSTAFIFHPGPVDWPPGKKLDVGELNGVAIELLRFYRHARVEEDWVEDREGRGSPALKFVLAGPDGRPVREEWLVADQFGSQIFIGPVKFEFQRVPMASMLEDFLKPPAADADKDGVLSMHYEGRVERVPVSKSVGKKTPIGDGKVQVEIAEYLPNATPGSGGKFVSRGQEPHNPLLELRVTLPGKEQPVRQIAFAKYPFLNLDGVHGASCPVKFYYYHPALTPDSGVEFLQGPDGKVYCRVGQDGKYESLGAVAKDQPIEVAAQFKVSIAELLANARREVSFFPLEPGPGEARGAEPAALVRVSAGGTTREVWMQRNHSEFGLQRIQTKEGPLELRFGNEHLPLGFSLHLVRFQRGFNPGRMGDASFASRVRLIDPHHGINEEREISMNEPLSHGKYTFYQSSFQELGGGKSASILSVAYDPGRTLKYLGSLMICLGIGVMFYRQFAGLLLICLGILVMYFSGSVAYLVTGVLLICLGILLTLYSLITWLKKRRDADGGGATPGRDGGSSSAGSNGKKTRKQADVDLAEIG